MLSPTIFLPVRLNWSRVNSYFLVSLFVAGNLVLPQLCHLIPSGGQIFLPIYFFTLIAAYKFGLKAGLATAILSPLVNSAVFGMPPLAFLPVILVKSCLLAVIASTVAGSTRKLSLMYLVVIVLAYQLIGSAVEWGITQSLAAAVADLTRGLPGIGIQIIGGWLILKTLAKYDRR